MDEHGWRTIESAPKDGSWVLVYGERFMNKDEPPMGLTRWLAIAVECWEYESPRRQKLVSKDESDWDSECGIWPTHWMSLPDPPPSA